MLWVEIELEDEREREREREREMKRRREMHNVKWGLEEEERGDVKLKKKRGMNFCLQSS